MQGRDELAALLAHNRTLQTILAGAPELELGPYYVAAGSIAQTVWNVQCGRPAQADIDDYDLVYFDDSDLSYEAEDRVIRRARALFSDMAPHEGPGRIEVRNEARVHVWYAEHFGRAIEPYRSVEHAIDTFPTIATSVGVRRNASGELDVYAPYGLADLFGSIVRANKRLITRDIYERKLARWTRVWPHLKIVAW
jgi:uncharacterized protein